MRQLFVRVPHGCGQRALGIAQRHGGTSMVALAGHADAAGVDLVVVQTSNGRVEELLGALEELPDLHVTLAPQGVITLKPPADQAARQAIDVEARSPVEIFLGGLQSVGSWTGFLGYAAASGVVVWIGLFTETVHLLTAAMLIAPFAGPAMNAALATAQGDAGLFGRSIGRYFAALGVAVAVALLLSTLLGQQIATTLMVQQSSLSAVVALLPVTAGAAGALNLCQSDRSSLVSGAATGMLVAAPLALTAGLVALQFAASPDLLRSSRAQRATADARQAVKDSGIAQLVKADAQFTRADIPGQHTLLVKVCAQADGPDLHATEVQLSRSIEARLAKRYAAVPLVDVTVLPR